MTERTAAPREPQKPIMIYRNITIELKAFDLLKRWQRRLQRTTGRLLTNSEVVNLLILNNPEP